jgi:hypothetical protein
MKKTGAMGVVPAKPIGAIAPAGSRATPAPAVVKPATSNPISRLGAYAHPAKKGRKK